MTHTRVAAAVLGLFSLGLALPLLVSGCAGGAAVGGGVSLGYASGGGRPHPRYYCADCHGVSYFDPYYDLCLNYGYRFDWRRQPEVTAAYRRDYAAIKRADPSIGSYRYPRGSKEETRKRLVDTDGRMPRYENAAPPAKGKGSNGPPRGPKVTGPRSKDERTSPPRGKAPSKGEKREPTRGKTGRDDGQDGKDDSDRSPS
jgi:hypothetical protein